MAQQEPNNFSQNLNESVGAASRKVAGFANKLAKPGIKRFRKKAMEVAVKAIKAVAKKIAMVIAKMITWLISTVGVPTVLIAIGVILLAIIISLVLSFLWGTGDGLKGEDKKIHDYIVQQSYSTVNMSSDLERPYRVPEKLIAATIMLDVFQKKNANLSKTKKIIKQMAITLKPNFNYGKFDEWLEKQVTVCEDGKCKDGTVKRSSHMVSKIKSVEYWSGSSTFKYSSHVSGWKKTEKITHKKGKVAVPEEYVESVKVPPSMVNVTDKGYPYYDSSSSRWDNLLKAQSSNINIIDTSNYVTVYLKKTRYKQVEKEIEVKTITKTRQQYFTSTKTTTPDYSQFDAILNANGLGLNDKKLIEANYIFLGGTINYIDWLNQNGGVYGFDDISFDGDIIAGGGVPAKFMPIYRAAEKKYGVHWYTLAALHSIETTFSTMKPPMVSSVGAIGHMQFMPATWAGWTYNIGGGLVSPNLDITNLNVIKKGGGYGVDGNNDGKADPYTIEDAVFSAANYLSKNGYAKDKRKAIYQYNHADWYVNKAIALAETFKTSATYVGGDDVIPPGNGGFNRPATGAITSGFGNRWGTHHDGIDIGLGGRANVKIVAAADGVVSRSYLSSSYGNVVFIKHTINGKKFETVYAHMQNRAVSVGATVKQGQFLGYMGATGDVTGPHLHFELHSPNWMPDKRYAKDPVKYIRF